MPTIPKQSQGRRHPCPACDHDKTNIKDTRNHLKPFEHTWRRRECPKCKHRFSTREFSATLDDLYGFMASGASEISG